MLEDQLGTISNIQIPASLKRKMKVEGELFLRGASNKKWFDFIYLFMNLKTVMSCNFTSF